MADLPQPRTPAAAAPAAGGWTPLVSVVMPFLDVAPYLAEAIESVRAQRYPHWELLLADDGARDGGTAIAQRYAAAEPARIRWLAHPGGGTRGASAARNLALAHARGELVAFLDGDDVWRPAKLDEQVALLAAHPAADALCGATEFWYGWTGRPEDAARDHVLRLGVPHGSLWPAPTFLARRLRGRAASPATCSLIVRRAAVERAGGFEESFRRVYTDQAFYVKLFLESSLLTVDTCWDRYRRHAASACASAERTGELARTRLAYLRWLREQLAVRGVHDATLRATLDRLLWRAEHPRLDRARTTVRRGARRLRQAAARLLLRRGAP